MKNLKRLNCWFSCEQFTVGLTVKKGVIGYAAPIVFRFKGQPLVNLKRWVENKKWGPIRIERLGS